MADFDYEFILPNRVIPQPKPHIVKIGDCGACVAGGILGVSISEAYDRLMWHRSIDEPKTFGWHGMVSVLAGSPEIEHVFSRVPIWGVDDWNAPTGPSGLQNWMTWADYIRMALNGGYYAVAQVDADEQGIQDDCYWLETNHWQMICGIRYTTSGSLKRELLVSCSSSSTPDEEWVSAKKFLAKRGGYNVILAKPST